MAAIVLTVGKAVDANVLINERIREELKDGTKKIEPSCYYEKAFNNLRCNVTTYRFASFIA